MQNLIKYHRSSWKAHIFLMFLSFSMHTSAATVDADDDIHEQIKQLLVTSEC